jgi:hypothetical protein
MVMISSEQRAKEGAPKMAEDFEYLFNAIQITPVLEDQRAKLRQRVEQIPSNKLLNASEHDLVQALLEEFRLEVPVLKEENHKGKLKWM